MMSSPRSNSIHKIYTRVYYEDTDALGMVYYAHYLRYAERARTEWCRERGLESSQLMQTHKLALVVRACKVDYLAAAHLDDLLMVETELEKIGRASLRVLQTIKRDKSTLVYLSVKLGCLNLSSGKPVIFPKVIQSCLSNIECQ